jgi:hypothetical protein
MSTTGRPHCFPAPTFQQIKPFGEHAEEFFRCGNEASDIRHPDSIGVFAPGKLVRFPMNPEGF